MTNDNNQEMDSEYDYIDELAEIRAEQEAWGGGGLSMIPKAPGKVAHMEDGEFLLLTPEEHRKMHGINKRAKRMTLDTNLISTDSLKAIKSIIDLEIEYSTDLKIKMHLFIESTFLGYIIKEREKKLR